MLPANQSFFPRTGDLWGDSWKHQELLHQLPSDLSLSVAVLCLFSISHLRGPQPQPVKVDSLGLCWRSVKRGKVLSKNSPHWAAPWSCSCVVDWVPAPSRPRWLWPDVAPKVWSAGNQEKRTSSNHVLTSWNKPLFTTKYYTPRGTDLFFRHCLTETSSIILLWCDELLIIASYFASLIQFVLNWQKDTSMWTFSKAHHILFLFLFSSFFFQS